VQNSLKLALTTRIIRTSAATMNRSTNGPFWQGAGCEADLHEQARQGPQGSAGHVVAKSA
jgi:hypothetical protein